MRRMLLENQYDVSVKLVETTLEDIRKKRENEKITITFIFQKGQRFSKTFNIYDLDYRSKWRYVKPGDKIRLKVQAGRKIVDIV